MRHLWIVVVIGLFFPTMLVADELADLKMQLQTMQANMEALQQKVTALESRPLPPPSPPSETTEPATTGAADVTADIEYLKAQQETLTQKLQESLEFNLYATLEYTSIDREPSAFDARSVELLIGGHLTDRLKGFAEIEFERTAKTSAGTRQGEVEVEQAWLEYSINEALKPRFGVILVPFGRYNLEHFEPRQELTSRPLMARRVTPTTWAEAGVGFTGRTQFGDRFANSWLGELSTNYQFFFVNGLSNHITDKGLRDARGAYGKDNNNNKAFVGRLGISPFSEQEIGVSGYYGSYDKKGHKIGGFDIDSKLRWESFELLGEYAHFGLDKGGVETDGVTAVPSALHGGYVQGNYRFWFDALNKTFLGRAFSHPTFTASLRYDWAHIDDDGDTDTGANREHRWTLGLNYRPVETWAFKLEYQFNDGHHEPLEHGDNDGFLASVTAAF